MSEVRSYRPKPLEVQAVQFTGANVGEIWDAFGCECIYGPTEKNPTWLILDRAEGKMRANIGDWIVRNVTGEFEPVKPDVFEVLYEPVPAPVKSWVAFGSDPMVIVGGGS